MLPLQSPDTSLAAATTRWKSLHHGAPTPPPPPIRPCSPRPQRLPDRGERDFTVHYGPRLRQLSRNQADLLEPPSAAIPEPRQPYGTTSRFHPPPPEMRERAAVNWQRRLAGASLPLPAP